MLLSLAAGPWQWVGGPIAPSTPESDLWVAAILSGLVSLRTTTQGQLRNRLVLLGAQRDQKLLFEHFLKQVDPCCPGGTTCSSCGLAGPSQSGVNLQDAEDTICFPGFHFISLLLPCCVSGASSSEA